MHSEQIQYLDVSSIQPYEHNPRTLPNPKYEQIKNSLLANGLETPLVVGKRPGDHAYSLASGGNTRLAIMRELSAQGQTRFDRVPCIVKEWSGDVGVILAHLRETEVHGPLTFKERANAVMQIGEIWAKNQGLRFLNQSQLSEELTSRGYPLSQSLISIMDYAVSRLEPHIPLALAGGLGRPSIAQIRKLDHAGSRVWDLYDADQEEDYYDRFSKLLAENDDADWLLDILRERLVETLVDMSGLDTGVVELMLSEGTKNHKYVAKRVEPDAIPQPLANDLGHSPEKPQPNPANSQEIKAGTDIEEKRINRLRMKHWRAAQDLAKHFDIDHLIVRKSRTALGYKLSSPPKLKTSDKQKAVWALLLSCSEITADLSATVAGTNGSSEHLDTAPGNALQSADIAEHLPIARFGELVLSALDRTSWLAWVRLQSSYLSLLKVLKTGQECLANADG